MWLADTHNHLYDEKFDADRETVIGRALDAGVRHLFLPAIDSESHAALFGLVRSHPAMCHPMMGLHPTSVNDNPAYRDELELVRRYLESPPEGIRFCAVGEVGLDLYWSRDYFREQEEVFRAQIELAIRYGLPLVIHTRDAWDEMCTVLGDYRERGIRGVMHSFSGTVDHYHAIKETGGFLFGIGGPVTYKKSTLVGTVAGMDLEDLLLETDAPYLPPVPHRGERNEPAYIPYICNKVAEIKGIGPDEVASVTARNAGRLFHVVSE